MRPGEGVGLLRDLPGASRSVALLAGLGTLAGVVTVAQAVTVAWVVAALVRDESLGTPLALTAALLLTRGLLAAAAEVAARRASLRVVAEVRSRLLRSWLSRGHGSRPRSTQEVTLAGAGLDSVEPYVARYLPALVTAAVVPALAVVVLLWVDPWSALIVVLTMPLLPLFAALIGLHTAERARRRLSTLHELSGHFLDVVRGLPTLVAYGRAERQVSGVAEVGERHRRATVHTLRTAFLSSAALELVATVSVAMVAVAVGLRLAYGVVDLQVALTAILLAPEAYWPIRRVGQEFHNAAEGAEVLVQVQHELTEDPAATPPSLPAPGVVRLEGVTFGYRERGAVLHDLSLATPGGAGLTTLTGESGSGKSTLLDLVAGLASPASGTVVAAPVHLARQRPVILPGRVDDVLRLGAPSARPHQCREALEAVGLWPAVAEREGLATVVGDDGFGLSAGQRTRLALARALLSSPEVVLLDEPTAHVDGDAHAVRELIVDMARTRRVIVATHDERLVRRADSRWHLTAGEATPAPERPEPATGPTLTGSDDALSWWQRTGVRTRIGLACVLGGSSLACGVALTATSGWLIVQASTRPVVLTLLVAIVGVRAFGLARPVLRYAERVVSHDATLEALTRTRTQTYQRLIPLTPARLGRRRRADLLTALVSDLDDVADEQVRARVPWWSTAIASVVAAVILAVVLPAAAAVVATGALLCLALAAVGCGAERQAQNDAVHARGRVRQVSTEVAERVDDVRAITGGDARSVDLVLGRLHGAQDARHSAETALIRARAALLAGLYAVLAVTVLGTTAVAAAALAAGAVSGPVAALVALTPVALTEAWVGLADAAGARARAREAGQRLESVLSAEPAVLDAGTRSLPGSALPVETAEILARWDVGQPSLGPFTLPPLEAGARVCVTGGNGIGKSTLLAVLSRQLDPVSGTHRLHGIPAAQVRLEESRAAVAVVDDEPHAFAGTVRANLRLANPGASDQDIRDALAAADLQRWLDHQPHGLDTLLRGLSGGERARLAIARAVLSGRPLVLLDEPVAHLDDATAARALRVLADDPRRAIVTVSHQELPDGLGLGGHRAGVLASDGSGAAARLTPRPAGAGAPVVNRPCGA